MAQAQRLKPFLTHTCDSSILTRGTSRCSLNLLCPLQVGDPQELNGITRSLCASRQDPLLIGSTKSNMGHPEPASGLAALTKVSRLDS